MIETATAAPLLGRKGRTVLVFLVAAAAYAGTLGHGLVWDDPMLVNYVTAGVEDGGGPGLLTSEFRLYPNRPTGYYRPIVLLSLWLDSHLSPMLPAFYHVTNVALHAFNSVLFLALAESLLAFPPAALIAGLVFALHPVHTESVAFVSGRTDLWAAFFIFLSALVWAEAGKRTVKRAWAFQAASALALALAAFSKETAFILPAVLLIWDRLRCPGGAREWLRRNISWIVAWGLALILVLAVRWWMAGVGFGQGIGHPGAGVGVRGAGVLSMQPLLWLKYLRLLGVPWPLNAYYTPAHLRPDWLSVVAAAGVVALCLLEAGRTSGRVGLLALSWIACFVVPVSGVVSFDAAVVAERFLYIPSAGLALVVGHATGRLLQRPTTRVVASGSVLLILFMMALGTVVRNEVWRDDLSLFEDITSKSPDYAMAYLNLGIAYDRAGRKQEAIDILRMVISRWPDFSAGYYNLGNLLSRQKSFAEAAAVYQQGRAREPFNAKMRYNLGLTYLALGNPGAASEEYLALKALDARLAAKLLQAISP